MSIDCSIAGKKAMRYIVELIDKKTLTGLQAGKVLIYDLINSRTRKENTPEDKQKLTEIYKKIRKDLIKWTSQETQIYKAYQNLQNWILKTYPEAQGRNDVAQSNINYFYNITSTIRSAEKISHLVEDVLKNSPEQKRIERKRVEKKLENVERNKHNKFSEESEAWIKAFTELQADSTPLESFRMLTLDRYADLGGDSDDYYLRGTLEKIYKRRLKENYYYLQGYNESLVIIAQYINIIELDALGFELDFFDQFNDCFTTLKEVIAGSNSSQEDRNRKQKIIDDIFSPINFKLLKTPRKKIERACRLLYKGVAFADGDYEFIDLFTQTDAFNDR